MGSMGAMLMKMSDAPRIDMLGWLKLQRSECCRQASREFDSFICIVKALQRSLQIEHWLDEYCMLGRSQADLCRASMSQDQGIHNA